MEIKDLVNELNTQFTEFKTANELGNVELSKKLDSEMKKTQKQIDDLNITIARANLGDSINEAKENNDSAEHVKSFEDYIRKGDTTGLRDIERKSMNTGTPADGGYLVPTVIQEGIVKLMRNASPMRSICNTISLSNVAVFSKNIQITGAAGGWVVETGTRVETGTPTFKQVNIPVHELYANPQLTNTMIEDANVDLLSFVSEDVSETFATLENTGFTVGTGTGQPTGVNDSIGTQAWDTIGEVVAGSATAIVLDDLVKLVYSLKSNYLPNAVFMMNRKTLSTLRSLKGTDGHSLLLNGAVESNAYIERILGYKVIVNEDLPDIATGTTPVYFADFKNLYQIVDRSGISVLVNPYKNPGFTEVYSRIRVGGSLLNGAAGLALTMG